MYIFLSKSLLLFALFTSLLALFLWWLKPVLIPYSLNMIIKFFFCYFQWCWQQLANMIVFILFSPICCTKTKCISNVRIATYNSFLTLILCNLTFSQQHFDNFSSAIPGSYMQTSKSCLISNSWISSIIDEHINYIDHVFLSCLMQR